jgi:hypothetical protein
MYNGGSLKVHTKVSGSISMSHSFLSILGFIQPKCLQSILQEKSQNGDGFWERFLLIANGGKYNNNNNINRFH